MPDILRPGKYTTVFLVVMVALVFPCAAALAQPETLTGDMAGVIQPSLIEGGSVIGENNRIDDGQRLVFSSGNSSIIGKHAFISLTLESGAVLRQDAPNLDLTDLTISGGSTYILAGGDILNISNSLTIIGNSTLLVQGKDNTGKVGGSWTGVGGTITPAPPASKPDRRSQPMGRAIPE